MKDIDMVELTRTNIQKHGYCLKEIENIIENEHNGQLNTVDRAYIKNKYIKKCLKYWIEEIDTLLNKSIKTDSGIIENLFALDNIKYFDEIPSPFNGLKYYQLLMKHKHLITQHKEETLMRRFKEKCLELSMTHSDTIVKEIDFLKALLEFLDMFEKSEAYPDMSELKYLYDTDTSNDKFFQIIMNLDITEYDVKLAQLQYAAQLLMNEKYISSMRKYKEIIEAYFKPITIKKLTIDNRLVVEIIAGNFYLSDIINDINSYMSSDSHIEEVRFVCSGIMYIDANLENGIWHGKNIVLYAKAIRVCGTIKWDISGKCADSIALAKASTDDTGDGINGEHGKCGESGGNVFIHADNVVQPQQLVISCNGGDGSDGQSGGDGRNGKDGTSISYADFMDKFPTCVTQKKPPAGRYRKMLMNIKNLAKIRVAWRNGSAESIDDMICAEKPLVDSYIDAVTEEGHEIYFSLSDFSGSLLVLYKGSLGESGGYGGASGLGGQGGYPGEVISNHPDIVIIANSGKKGEDGNEGSHGKHGQNSWDIGYIDWIFWTEGIYYGTNQNKKLMINYYNGSSSNRVYVPYCKSIGSNCTYAQILEMNIPTPESMTYTTERKETSTRLERQAYAERKKNISQNHIFTQYSQYLVKLDIGFYQNLQAQMKTTEKHVFEKMMENRTQHVKAISQVTVTRTKPSFSNRKSKNFQSIPTDVRQTCEESVEVLLKKLRDDSLDDWFELGKVQLEYSNFNKLFVLFESLKINYTSEVNQIMGDVVRLRNIEQLLIQKYRLAILQNISIKMARYQNTIEIPQLIPEKATKYLLQVKDNPQVDLHHSVLETLEQYFFEDNEKQRKKIAKFCTAENMAKYPDAFTYSIGAFVMDEGEIRDVNPKIKKYHREYSNFIGKQEVKLKNFFRDLQLEADSYNDIIAQWFRSLNNATKTKLKRDLKKDENLEILYEHFTERFSERFNWGDCCKDPEILKNYVQHIQEHGPLSPSYRELLAYIFDINICVYIVDQGNNIHLLDVHNPQSTEIVYMLHTKRGFTRPGINRDFLLLDMERQNKANLCTRIIMDVDSLQRKTDCDEYMRKELFFSGNKDHSASIIHERTIDEKQDIFDIIRFFPSEEKYKLRFLLEKTSSKYTGRCEILHAIAKCFSCNGRHVTYHELYCFINALLSFIVEDRPGLNVFCWIITAFPQRQWINEIILLRLENHFQRLLPEIHEWREYLANIRERGTLLLLNTKLEQCKLNKTFSMECVKNILYLLSNISGPVPGLQWLELSEWPYAIKEKYWTTKLSALTEWEDEKLQRASYYLLSLENSVGTTLIDKFIDLLVQKDATSKSSENKSFLSLNKLFLRSLWKKDTKKGSISMDDFLRILLSFHNGEWNFSEKVLTTFASCQIDEWLTTMRELFPISSKDRDTSKLIELIKSNGNTSKAIMDDLLEIEDIIQNMSQRETVNDSVITEEIAMHRSNIWDCEDENAKIQYVFENTGEILGLIDDAIQLKRRFRLRNTQKLAILTLLRNKNNTLMQVSTGEGKSLIVVALSIFKALCGQKVDIITSSSVLAKRDADINSDIYELFSISVSHNCDNDVERRKEVYSCKNVVYGELAGFQRDYLLDRFYGKNILGDRSFQNVVIDEVDSMLLDKGNNMLYLSHDLPCLDKLESIYVYIWQLINRPFTSAEDFLQNFDNGAIRQAVLCDMYGSMSKESIRKLDVRMGGQKVNTIWECLIKYNIIDNDGYLLRDNVSEEDIRNVLPPDFESYGRHLVYLFKEIVNRDRFIQIPNYLKSFVSLHLDAWIISAKTALLMQERQDYIVDVDRKETRPDLNANITIIDRDTGTDQTNSQWDEALHQFLQLKHGCKLSMQSLKAVFVSNVRYLKLYGNLYGLTGTLGSQRERDLLREIYKADFATVPTTKTRKFHECNPIVCSNPGEWSRKIRVEVDTLIASGRSVLIICETVRDVESLYRALSSRKSANVHTYTRDYESFDIAAENERLRSGQIIIATNLAGRGTDIKITDEVDQAGGLHVCLTYLPNNNRVEQQAFGRAARCGNNGSGRLIILGSHDAHSISQTSRLKKEHDFEEIRHISDIKLHYETRVSFEEDAFRRFKDEYVRLKDNLQKNKKAKKVAETLLRSCLDEWAFWLDENGKYINGSQTEQDIWKYKASLGALIDRLQALKVEQSEDWIYWIREPTQHVKLAKYFAQNKQQDMAIKLFDRVIKEEPYFSEAAHYYKAFSLIKKLNKNDRNALKELKSELRQACTRLEKHRDYALMAGNIIDTLKHRNPGIMQIDAFKEQHKNISILYQIFLQSIDDILGHHVTPQSFEKYDINEELAETLYDDLIENDILKKSKLSKSIPEESTKKISKRHGMIWTELNAFLAEYRGCNVDIKQLEKDLKISIRMPDKEDFWKLLVKANILTNEVKYVKIMVKKLRNIDPSFLDLITNRVKERILENYKVINADKQELLLHAQVAVEDDNDDIALEKETFKKLVSGKKYRMLKRRNILLFNKKATFDSSKVDSVIFSRFDSITLRDFTERDILVEEAKQILANLVEQKILMNKENCYRLITSYDEIANLQLSCYPIYQNFVISLLNVCFMYRIALQKLMRDFEEEVPVTLQISTKPYQSIICSLIEERIIKPTKVVSNITEVDKKLECIYDCIMTKDAFMRIFYQSELIQPTKLNESLFNYVVQKEWIDVAKSRYNDTNVTENSNAIIFDPISLSDYYSLHASVRDKIIVLVKEGTPNDTHSSIDSIHEETTKTIKNIIDTRNHLSRKDTIKYIATTLEGLKNALKALDVPDCRLTSLIEHTEACKSFGSGDYPAEELHVFAVNGLDHLLILQEKPWTWKMLLKTAGIVVLGIMQIVVGNMIELFSAGSLSYLAGAFISEGISDIFFAMTTLRSGHFSWNSYKQHKIMSLAITGFTFGIGALVSSTSNTSSFAMDIVGPNVSAGGVEVTEMTGTTLLEQLTRVGNGMLTREFTKRVALSTLEGISFGLASTAVDSIVDNYLQNLCRDIGFTMMAEIDQTVERHDMSNTLEMAYRTLGREDAIAMVKELSNNYFTRQGSSELARLCNRAVYAVVNIVKQAKIVRSASEKTINGSIKIKTLIKIMGATGTIAKKVLALHNLTKLTSEMLNTLNEDIKAKLAQLNIDVRQMQEGAIMMIKMNNFKQEVKDTWKSLLRVQAGLVIEDEIVKPVMHTVASMMVSYAGKQIQTMYNNYKEHTYSEEFQRYKREYEENMRNLQEEPEEVRAQVEKEYHDNLKALLMKTCNPQLFADIIRENVQMDTTCIAACLPVLQCVLASRGINARGLTIIVEDDTGLSEKLSSAPAGFEGAIIRLHVVNGHFQMSENDVSSNILGDASKNNCLYETLCQYIPELKDLNPDEFREQIAKEIESNPEIQERLSYGWHRYRIAAGLIGGRREPNRDQNITHEQTNDDYKRVNTWKENDLVDVNLTITGTLNNEQLHEQRTKALNIALQKCNEYLEQAHDVNRNRVFVNPEDFRVTLYDTIFVTDPRNGNIVIGYFPVEMKATIDVLIPGTQEKVTLTVEINIDNPAISPVENGPMIPHVGYKISGPKRVKYRTCGHVVINEEGNEHLPHRRSDNNRVDPISNKIIDPNSKFGEKTINTPHRIPIGRLFHGPSNSKLILERTDMTYDRNRIRGKSFVSIFY